MKALHTTENINSHMRIMLTVAIFVKRMAAILNEQDLQAYLRSLLGDVRAQNVTVPGNTQPPEAPVSIKLIALSQAPLVAEFG